MYFSKDDENNLNGVNDILSLLPSITNSNVWETRDELESVFVLRTECSFSVFLLFNLKNNLVSPRAPLLIMLSHDPSNVLDFLQTSWWRTDRNHQMS